VPTSARPPSAFEGTTQTVYTNVPTRKTNLFARDDNISAQ
jgi:hypothetical protein